MRRLSQEVSQTVPGATFRKRLYDLASRPHIMAILNVTPDSFSGDGIFDDVGRAVTFAKKWVEEGADIIDVGGESTRPGSKEIPAEEELRRVIPVIERLSQEVDVPISIDTRRAKVAEAALNAGAEIINDVSGLRYDPEMLPLITERRCYFVLTHSRGTPETMQREATYDSVVEEVERFFCDSIGRLEKNGFPREKLWLDPGLGFAKKREHNLELLAQLDRFLALGCAVLVGPSRKSFIGEILQSGVDQRLEGTLASVAHSVWKGVHIVRVHDVLATQRFLKVLQAIPNH